MTASLLWLGVKRFQVDTLYVVLEVSLLSGSLLSGIEEPDLQFGGEGEMDVEWEQGDA